MSGRLVVSDVEAFYEALEEFLRRKDLRIFPPRPAYQAKAHILRRKRGQLTYFDSLHANVSVVEGMKLVSYDKTYASVAELEYRHPRELLRG